MRFSFFFTLLMTTFAVSCNCFINAKPYSLDDRTYDNTEVRRLRGNDDIKEERGALTIAEEVAEQVGSSTTKMVGGKTEKDIAKELQKTIAETLDRMGRKQIVTKTKFSYEKLALILFGAAVAGTTAFAIHHLMSEAYDPKITARPTTNTTSSGSA